MIGGALGKIEPSHNTLWKHFTPRPCATRKFYSMFFFGVCSNVSLFYLAVPVRRCGGGCHLSVKAALPSSRPGVLGQLASELASVTVEEWTLNNRAYSSALPPGRLAGWLAGVTRQDGGQSQLQSITFT